MKTIKQPFGSESGNELNVGVAGANVTAAEYGDGMFHVTKFSFADLLLIAPVGAADLAAGFKLYDFPAGKILIRAVSVDLSLSNTVNGTAVCANDTPVVAIGNVIGSGATDAVADFDQYFALGSPMTDCAGTASSEFSDGTAVKVLASDPRGVFLSVADGWAGADEIGATGSVVIEWTLLSI